MESIRRDVKIKKGLIYRLRLQLSAGGSPVDLSAPASITALAKDSYSATTGVSFSVIVDPDQVGEGKGKVSLELDTKDMKEGLWVFDILYKDALGIPLYPVEGTITINPSSTPVEG